MAEVLITLAIIGIVAALTIPNLVKNYQQHQYIVQLKKVQNTLNQAVYMYIAQGGKINCERDGFSGFNIFDLDDIASCIMGDFECNEINGIKKNLSIISVDEDTIYNKVYDKPIYGINGEAKETYGDQFFFLKDGSAFKFSITSGHFLGNLPKGYCWAFITDINGPFKKPNRVGYDVFGFYLTEKGQVVPVGSQIGDYKSGIYEARQGKNKKVKTCSSLSSLGGGLCATSSALSGKNPDGTEYWKGIKYWNDIK